MKTCTKCKITKADSDFGRKGNRVNTQCKLCDSERKRKWRKANPGKVKAIRRKHYLANPERDAERKRKWRQANPEKEKETRRKRLASKVKDSKLAATKSKPPQIVFRERAIAFSPRETEVLKLYAHGKSYKEMAEALGISPATAGTYLVSVREKMGAKSRADVVAVAFQFGFMTGSIEIMQAQAKNLDRKSSR